MSSTITCPDGHYCPIKSIVPTPCSPGTFNVNTASTSSGACTSCPINLYCDEYGMTDSNSQKVCAGGYLCTGGAVSPYPIETAERGTGLKNNRKCPVGYKCAQGDTTPTGCSAGEFQNSFAQNTCKSCPPGYYCAGGNLSNPTGPCAAGYMCYAGATTSSPTDGTKGEVCPIGSYCSSGSAKGIECADGTRTTVTGRSTCDNCDAGKYCISSTQFDCPTRRYCVAGSVRGELCEPGRYNEGLTGLTANSQCTACPERVYCIDGTKGSDYCESGHICTGGAITPLPTSGTYPTGNYECPLGRYCLKAGATGVNLPLECSSSKYTYSMGSDSLDDCLTCEGGYYCPTTGFIPIGCPVGKYCVRGSTETTDCPINTVRTTVNAAFESDCAQCTGGFFCDTVGLGSLTGKECSLGKFCPIGTSSMINCPSGTYRPSNTIGSARDDVTDCQTCSEHYYCPEGSSARIQCTNGQVCPSGSSLPKLCEAGNECAVSTSPFSVSNSLCPVGYYCPQGATTKIACAGFSATLCPQGSKFEGGQSTTCAAGFYLSGSVCKYCDLGYVCLAGGEISNPTDGTQGYICPKGHYCDARISVLEIDCPAGTYNPSTKGTSTDSCLPCPSNYYMPSAGQPY